MNAAVEQFINAIETAGLTPPASIIADDKIHRFPSNGEKHGDDGWYIFHDDGIPAGAYGDWSKGLTATWRADVDRELTTAEKAAYRAKVAAAKKLADAEDVKRKAEVAEKAAGIWKRARPAPDDHVYLLKKKITAHGARVHNGELVIPMYDGAKLHSLQFIKATGEKRFLAGGRAAGCYFLIENLPAKAICVCEGFATGATIASATGYSVAVAFSAGNLLSVARTMRRQFPDLKIILCADDDHRTDGNPGITKATDAARAIGGLIAVPDFHGERPEDFTDFNDMYKHFGGEVVEAIIRYKAKAPDDGNNKIPAADGATPGDTAKTEWPELEEAALYGLPGDIVRAITPHTEADPSAILIQTLIAFGSFIGRGCHVKIDGAEHHANLYAVLVGKSSKSRKGTSWARVLELFSPLHEWCKVASGLSSGEGLKYHVRDEVEAVGGKGGDPGVEDKRLLVIEQEFSQVLRVVSRPGNTLSPIIREAWDGKAMGSLTKHDAITATGAHISIISHITQHELRAELSETQTGNGFANRFLFCCVGRSNLLPFGGGDIDQEIVCRLRTRIAYAKLLAHNFAITKEGGKVEMTETAKDIWANVYPVLSEGFDGLLGAVTARAEAQVRRLAMLYALMGDQQTLDEHQTLDERRTVDDVHLLAALALWRYCEHSARCVFGSAVGDRVMDEIMRGLTVAGKGGLTRTEISELFKRHEKADRIGAALESLKQRNLVTMEDRPTDGRSVQIWRLVSAK